MPKTTKQTEEEKRLVAILKEYIRIHKLTQVEMADRLEVTQGTLSNWLVGNNGITPSCQEKIKFICRGIIVESEANNAKELIKQKAIKAIMESSMCADCKVTAFKILEAL